MFPDLFTITLPLLGELTITSFGAMMALAFLAGWWVIRRRLRELGEREELAGEILIAALLGGIAGAKLYYVLLNWPRTVADPAGMLLARAGLVWYGGVIGGALAVWYVIHRRREALALVADVTAPALALSYGIGRIGCFLVGDDYGRPTESWLGIAFPEGSPPTTAANLERHFGVDVPAAVPPSAVLEVYPTQLFESGAAFLIFLWLWNRRENPHRDGWLFGLWLVLAGAERLAIEFFRAKDDRFFGPFTAAQLISVALMGGGAYILHRERFRVERRAEVAG